MMIQSSILLLVVFVCVASCQNQEPLWTTKFNATYNPDGSRPSFGPFFYKSTLITIVADTNAVFSLDKETGKVLWSWTPPDNFCGETSCRLQPDIHFAQDRSLFAVVSVSANPGKPTSTLAALDLNGNLKWQKPLHGGSFDRHGTWQITYAVNGLLLMFAESQPQLTAVDITDGSVVWQDQNNTIYTACWASTQGIMYDSATDLIISSCTLSSYGWTTKGELVWSYNRWIPTQNSVLSGTLNAPGALIERTRDGKVCSLPLSDPNKGHQWCYDCQSYCSPLQVSPNDGSILFQFSDAKQTNISLFTLTKDGEPLWTVPSFVTFSTSYVYLFFPVVGSNGNYFITTPLSQNPPLPQGENIVELNSQTGDVVHKISLGVSAFPFYADDKLVFTETGYSSLAAYPYY